MIIRQHLESGVRYDQTFLPLGCRLLLFASNYSALTPRGRSNYPQLEMLDLACHSKESQKGILFCSRSLILLSLFTRGRKLVGSRRNVISREAKKRFIPERRDCGLQTVLNGDECNNHEIHLRCCCCCNSWLALEDDNTVSEVSCHDEVVFNDESSLLRVEDKAKE